MNNRIKELREERDERQIDVSLATGIAQVTLSNYETGKTKPDSDALIRLATYFGVTIDYLVGYSSTVLLDSSAIRKELGNIKAQLHDLEMLLASRPRIDI